MSKLLMVAVLVAIATLLACSRGDPTMAPTATTRSGAGGNVHRHSVADGHGNDGAQADTGANWDHGTRTGGNTGA